MATYKKEKGFAVQTLSSDPVASAIAGSSWSTGGNLPQALYENAGAGATQSASMNFGGQGNPPGPAHPFTADTQTYDGTSWTEVNNLNNGRRFLYGAGTLTSAIAFGGYTTPPSGPGTQAYTETWNGSSWTETTDLNTKRRDNQGIGISSSNALAAAGYDGTTVSANVESWNGSSWTEVAEKNTLRYRTAATGSNTAGIIAGGEIPSTAASALVESWNGSAWTEISDLSTARQAFAGAGTYTETLVMGGTTGPSSVAKTEYYDGSSWSEQADLANARYINYGGSGDTVAQSMVFGGEGRSNSTEEWNQPSTFDPLNVGQVYYNSGSNAFKVTQQLASAGTWSSGGNLNTARFRFGGAVNATQNAGLVFGAGDSPYGQTEEYNGTAWSEQNDLNTGRYISYGGAGTQTACVTAGGYNPAGSPAYNTVVSETYNGTSWTEGNDLNEGRIDCSTFGTSTDGVLVGGGEGPGGPGTVTSVEVYNGTSWTETTDIPTATQEMGSLGLGTAGLIFGGSVDSTPTAKNTTVEWNGTSWTSGGTYPISVFYTTGFGSLTNGIGAGGIIGPPGAQSGVCCVYNGTSWSEVAELTTARMGTSGNGIGTSGFVAGGETASSPKVTTTEEWNVSETNRTITVS